MLWTFLEFLYFQYINIPSLKQVIVAIAFILIFSIYKNPQPETYTCEHCTNSYILKFSESPAWNKQLRTLHKFIFSIYQHSQSDTSTCEHYKNSYILITSAFSAWNKYLWTFHKCLHYQYISTTNLKQLPLIISQILTLSICQDSKPVTSTC